MCKNESDFIGDTLDAVKPFIDCWSVLDTGSTDGTQSIVCAKLAGIPGALHEGKWEGWDKSRTESIDFARQSGAEWIFILDADEKFQVPEGFQWPVLDPNIAYEVTIEYGNIRYIRPNLISVLQSWRYTGVTHEYLWAPEYHGQSLLPVTLVTHPTRTNKTPEKCAEDARILEEALITEPDNCRYVFYLAQSYKDSLQKERAIETYKKRAEMGGWAEEVYISLLRVAQLSEGLKTFPEVCDAYKVAQEYRPQRAAETLRNLSRYCLWWANGMPYPEGERLFIDESCYLPHKKPETLKVLVVIPTHDRINFFEQAIASVNSQTRKAGLVITGNVGPQEPSDAPLAERLNNAIRNSDCDAFVVLGDDDLLETTFIEKTAAKMEETGCDIVHTLYSHFGAENCVRGSSNHISTTSLVRKAAWEKAGGFVDGIPYWDWDFYWSCIDTGAKTEFLPEPLWKYRIGPQQESNAETVAEQEKNRAIILARHMLGKS
jgi:glycosyltransferase involved in cell wall biosynthesis